MATLSALNENDDLEDEEDDETLYGLLRVPIVGIRYYRGVVHQGEWVDLVREPNNPYDRNAIRVDNQSGIQVGHIGRDFAYNLRPIMDGVGEYESVRIECIIPNAPNGVYRIGALITMYGPENLKERLSSQIRRQVYQFQAASSGDVGGSSLIAVKKTVNKISPMKTQDELNKMFDKLEEETKMGDMLGSDNFDNLIKPLKSTLFPHQLFGVKWMIHRESIFHLLPPFWEEKIEKSKKVYYNGITASSTPNKPENVGGGILADDMGLGKTIQTIALIISNPPKSIASRGGYQQLKDGEGKINPYKKMKLKDLKIELKTRGVNAKGKKGDLIAALDKSDVSLPKATLIICPTSVLATWLSQISQHVSDGYLNTLLYHGSNRNINPDVLKNYDIILTSYGTVNHEFRNLIATQNGSSSSKNNNNVGMNGNKKRKHGSSASSQGLFALNYHRIVLDEAHMIRNRNTKSHKAVLNLKSTNRWCLTGTPLQNKAEDMQSLFAFLKCKPINEFKVWKRSIGRLIKDGDELGLARLRVFVRSICLRRSKSLLADKLPARTIELHSLEMDGQQKTIYDELFESAKYIFTEVSKGGDGDNVFRNYSSVLELLLRLRQATCSPSMIKKERLNAAREILKNAVNGGNTNKKKLTKEEAEILFAKIKGVLAVDDDEKDHECAVCFEDLTGANDLLRVLRACGHPFCKDCLKSIQQVHHSEIRCPLCRVPFQKQDIINPSLVKETIEADTLSSNGGISSSSSSHLISNEHQKVAEIPVKVRALLKEIQKVVAKREKALIFSNFTSFLDVIASFLKINGIVFGRIDGRMSTKKRLNASKSFSDDKNVSCMLISTKAGGTGLNLIEANHVFIMDLWWNFSSEEQAMDRCYRIGQQKNVHVIRYCCKDSVEERILKIQERKHMLAKGSMQKQTPEERRQARLDELTSMFQ